MNIKKDIFPEWLGVLPDGWELTDIGRVFEERK